MRLKRSTKTGLIYCLIFAIIATWLADDYFSRLELRLYDVHMRNNEILTHPDIILITVDNESVEKIGEWPFSRDLIAKVIDYVSQGRPSVIASTILLPDQQADMGLHYLYLLQEKIEALREELIESGEDSDPTLDALQKELENTLISLRTDEILASTTKKAGNFILPLELHPSARAITTNSKEQQFKSKYALENHTDYNFNQSAQHYKIKISNPTLADSVELMGHINKQPDFDDVVRSEQLFWAVDNYLIPSLSLRIYSQHISNQKSLDLHAQPFHPESVTANQDGKLQLDELILDYPTNGKVLSRFYSGRRNEVFKQFSFYDVFVEGVSKKEFENKIILMGPTAPGTTSRTKVSSGQFLTPVENLAQVTSSLLNEDWIHRGPKQVWFEAFLYVIIGIYLIFFAAQRKVFTNTVVTFGGIALLLVFEFGSLEFSYWYKMSTLCWFLLIGMGVLLITSSRLHEYQKTQTSAERDHTNLQLGLAFHKQGALDLAFEKFLNVSQNAGLLSPLYNLALEYERRRQFAKSSAVYEVMAKIDPNYLDLEKRMTHSSNMSMQSTHQMHGTGSNLVSLLHGDAIIEKPRLGRYELENEIGRGAMSIVYAGRDPSINRVVAIKVQSFTGDDPNNVRKMRERFMTEAKTAGRLNHPNIITIYDVGEEVDLIYIAMEYLTGTSLDLVIEKTKLPDEVLLDICVDLANALVYAHQKRVIHRDIKPSNVIYDQKTGNIHLTDFGIARMQDAHLTQTGQVVGTPSYMSPEQITGKRVDHRSDLFSFGTTMYQLFTGKLPFQADTMATLLYKITADAPIPFEAIRPDLPTEFSLIISKLLEKEPENRYQSTEELAKALEDCKNSLNKTA